MFSTDMINALSALGATTVTLVSLLWSIYVSIKLMRKDEDKLTVTVDKDLDVERELNPESNGENSHPLKKVDPYLLLSLYFISPLQRKTSITQLGFEVHKTILHYYLNKIHFPGKWLKCEVRFSRSHKVASLFSGGVVDLKDGDFTMYKKSHKELIKELNLKKKNILVIGIHATPNHNERVRINATHFFNKKRSYINSFHFFN